jgi:hypothetical protein
MRPMLLTSGLHHANQRLFVPDEDSPEVRSVERQAVPETVT